MRISINAMEHLANIPHVAKIALGLAALFAAYQIIQQLTVRRRRQAIAREKGCLPSPSYPQFETILGWEQFSSNIRAIRNHTNLELTYDRFKEMGVNTFQVVVLGRRIHITTEPENLKTIQAINFKHWGLGIRRKMGFRPLLGDGKSSHNEDVAYVAELTSRQESLQPTVHNGSTLAKCCDPTSFVARWEISLPSRSTSDTSSQRCLRMVQPLICLSCSFA